ncbi:MAG: carboxypeptidase-like regulatory domain-containing protein, partial [bacterium]
LRQDIRWVILNGTVKRGIGNDYANHTKGELESYQLGLSCAPSRWQSYNASFQTGHSSTSLGARRTRTVALSASYRPIQWLWLSAGVQKGDWGNQSDFENDLLSVDARCSLSPHHTVAFRFRQQDYKRASLGERTSYIVSYEIPLGLPLAKVRDTGCVKGRIFDAEDANLKGLSDVLLSLGGMTTLTNQNGDYLFASVTPGAHYMQVERAGIGLDRVTLQKSPIEVSVRGGKSEKVDLGVIRSAAIRGEIALFGLAENKSRQGIFVESGDSAAAQASAATELTRLVSLPNIQLELRRDGEVLSTTTDQQGRFSFDEVRPGEWELRVLPDNLPPYHHPEPAVTHLALNPGSKQEIALRVIPQTRRIHIVDEGKVPVVTRRLK